jgi:hypothetical protein
MKLMKILSILKHTTAMLALVVLLTGVSQYAFGQTTASLSGNVQDRSGALVPNARVVLTNVATNDKRELQSNEKGYFTFAGVIPGTYTVDISAPGYRSLRQADIMVNPGDVRDLPNLSLEVGASTENVTVESSANYVAPEDSGERSALLTTRDICRFKAAICPNCSRSSPVSRRQRAVRGTAPVLTSATMALPALRSELA